MADELTQRALAAQNDPNNYGLSPLQERTLSQPTDSAGYEKLTPGSLFRDPNGMTRQKPWKVTNNDDYTAIPEGGMFTDPQGVLRQKPTYEGVGFEAQALYDMGTNDKERENALIKFYGKESLKRDASGAVYVEKDGKKLKPGSGSLLPRAGAEVAAQAAPVALGIGGEILGGLAGAAGGPAGVVGGAIGGGALGGGTGQAINDLILGIAGTYDKTPGEEAKEIGLSGVASGIGTAVGGAAGVFGPSIARSTVNAAKQYGRPLVRNFIGVDNEAIEALRPAWESGAHLPVASFAKEAPHLNLMERFAKQFGYDPWSAGLEDFYQRKAGTVFDRLGIHVPHNEITKPQAAVSSSEAGEAVLTRVRTGMADADTKLAAAEQAAREAVERSATMSSRESEQMMAKAQSAVHDAHQAALTAVQTAIDAGWKEIHVNVKDFAEAAAAGAAPGDLLRTTAKAIADLNKAVKGRAAQGYRSADAAAGTARPNVEPLRDEAQTFLATLPQEFQSKYPIEVRALARLGEEQEGEKAGELVAGEDVTFGMLHHVRSWLRHGIDYQDLTPGMREGALMRFSKAVDAVLHDQEAAPSLKNAARLLDQWDAFYAKNIPRFQNEIVQGLVTATKAGLEADPAFVAKTILRPDQTEAIREIRKMITPERFNAVLAADTKSMLDQSRTLVPGRIDATKFAQQVEERIRNGVMDSAYRYAPELRARVVQQAQRVMAQQGKLELEALPGDTVASLLKRANELADQGEKLARTDPVKTLSDELKKIDEDFAKHRSVLNQARRNDPAHFLFDMTATGAASADRILRNGDLVKIIAKRFGTDSDEWQALRAVAAQRILQRTFKATGTLQRRLTETLPADVQELFFPGVSNTDVHQLADIMARVLPVINKQETSSSMAAVNVTQNPEHFFKKKGAGIVGHALLYVMPTPIARAMVGNYLKVLTYNVSHPRFIRWLADGIDGTPQQQQLVKRTLDQIFATTGAAGAGAGAAARPTSGSTTRPPPTPQRPSPRP